MADSFTVKDSGVREEYASGMRRDTQDGKPDYTLIDREGLRRYAQHLTLGAGKYGRDNWRLADSQEELERFRSSAMRHLMQWLNGDRDEDHASAVKFNLDAAEYVQARLTEPSALERLARKERRSQREERAVMKENGSCRAPLDTTHAFNAGDPRMPCLDCGGPAAHPIHDLTLGEAAPGA